MPPIARAKDGWSYMLEYRRCKSPCGTCARGRGHGPYWYRKRREGRKVVTQYLGKNIPKEVNDEQPNGDV